MKRTLGIVTVILLAAGLFLIAVIGKADAADVGLRLSGGFHRLGEKAGNYLLYSGENILNLEKSREYLLDKLPQIHGFACEVMESIGVETQTLAVRIREAAAAFRGEAARHWTGILEDLLPFRKRPAG